MENKDIDELQEKLNKNIDKAVEFAEKNTKRNNKGEVLYTED